MALGLVVVNGDKDGKLDGVNAVATVTGAEGAVVFTASRRPPELSPVPVAVTAKDLGAGKFELTMPDRWLWYVTATSGGASATAPVWVWLTDLVIDLEVAEAARAILVANKPAIEARARTIAPDWTLREIILGMREEIDVVPALEISAAGTTSGWRWAPLGRHYEMSFQICVYAHWTDDVISDQQLLIQSTGAVRDVLTMYEKFSLGSGLRVVDFVPDQGQYMETLAMDGKVIGMGVLGISAKAEWAIPTADGGEF